MSPVTFLKAGLQHEEYSHLISFRRQVYVTPPVNEMFSLPSTALVNYDDIEYRIFLTFDEMNCFICKNSGHIARNCPNANRDQQDTTDPQITQERPPTQQVETMDIQTAPHNSLQHSKKTSNDTKKRPAPSSTVSSDPDKETDLLLLETQDDTPATSSYGFPKPPPKPTNKKLKKSTSTEDKTLEAMLKPAKPHIEDNSADFVLTYDNLLSFLEDSHGNTDLLSEARKYTPHVNKVMKMLNEVYSHVADRSIKSRITRIMKKLKEQMKAEVAELSRSMSMSSIESLDLSQRTDDDDPFF